MNLDDIPQSIKMQEAIDAESQKPMKTTRYRKCVICSQTLRLPANTSYANTCDDCLDKRKLATREIDGIIWHACEICDDFFCTPRAKITEGRKVCKNCRSKRELEDLKEQNAKLRRTILAQNKRLREYEGNITEWLDSKDDGEYIYIPKNWTAAQRKEYMRNVGAIKLDG